MRRTVIAIAAAVALIAASDSLATNKHEEPLVTHTATGVIKKIEPASGRITLRHEPIAALGWPAMTMPFNVKDRKILGNVKTEQRVQFEFVQSGGAPLITAIH